MKNILLAFFMIIVSFQLFSQAPSIQWENTIGGSQDDVLKHIEQTTDGGYILGGYSYSNISGDKTENAWSVGWDYWVVKLDSLGSIKWQNTIGGTGADQLNSIHQTTDGGYILGGHSVSNISGDKTENSIGDLDLWIIKLDSTGNIKWQKTIGGNTFDFLQPIQQTSDGGYILGGSSMSGISGNKTEICQGDVDYWVVKLDSVGNIVWQNTIGGSSEDQINSIQETNDGGYILAGYSESNISGDKTENCHGNRDFWIIKLNSLGNVLWQNTIGGINNDEIYSIDQTNDHGYILGGYSNSNISGDKTENSMGDYDFWILKLDSIGNIKWQNTIGGSDKDQTFYIKQTIDGGYVLGGYSASNISGDKTENSNGTYDYWVIKLSSIGEIIWQKTMGGNNFDYLKSMDVTVDGGYIIGGHSDSNISGDKTESCIGSNDYWVVKLGTPIITKNISENLFKTCCTIFPNPTNSVLQIIEKNNSILTQIIVTDLLGKIFINQEASTQNILLNIEELPTGVYVINVKNQFNNIYTDKLIIY